MKEQQGRPGRDSFPSSMTTGSDRFSARWLGPGGGPSPAGALPGPRTAGGTSHSHLARSASRLALGCLGLPPAFPSLYRGVPQAGPSPAASPGPVRGSQVGLRPWLCTVASGSFSSPRLLFAPPSLRPAFSSPRLLFAPPSLRPASWRGNSGPSDVGNSRPSPRCVRRRSGNLVLSFY